MSHELVFSRSASTGHSLVASTPNGNGHEAAAPSAAAFPTPILPGAIASFSKNTEGLPGFTSRAVINLKMSLSKKEKAKGADGSLKGFNLGRPAVRPGTSQFALATDNPEAQQHFLAVMDGEVMLRPKEVDPVLTYLPISQHTSDMKWLNQETLLCATGKGNLKLFHYKEAQLKHVGDLEHASTSYIREVGMQPGTAHSIVVGGFDHQLNFLDLNRPDSPFVQRLDMLSGISSIKWQPLNNGVYVSCGLDEGKFYLFDARQRIEEAAFYMDTRKEDLFTHERYNDYNVLLGYGDGEFRHIDMRQPGKTLSTVVDPYVEVIGGIEYNAEADAFVVSGYTDFSVWKMQGSEMKIWSHSDASTDMNRGNGYACSSVWYDRNTVLISDNAGGVGLFLQDWE